MRPISGQIGEQIRQPYFADEAGGADQQNIFSAQRGASGKNGAGRCAIRSALPGRTLSARRVRRAGSLRRGLRDFSRSRESLISFSRGTRPSGWLPVNLAKAPRGRITGSSKRPVAMPSRKSRRLEMMRAMPRCFASGRMMWSRPWLTSTISLPAAMASRSFAMPGCFRRGFRKYSKNSSPSRSRRSRLTPRRTVCSRRVAKTRLVT